MHGFIQNTWLNLCLSRCQASASFTFRKKCHLIICCSIVWYTCPLFSVIYLQFSERSINMFTICVQFPFLMSSCCCLFVILVEKECYFIHHVHMWYKMVLFIVLIQFMMMISIVQYLVVVVVIYSLMFSRCIKRVLSQSVSGVSGISPIIQLHQLSSLIFILKFSHASILNKSLSLLSCNPN